MTDKLSPWRHKIFHPSKWKDIDFPIVVANYEVRSRNFDSVANIIQRPYYMVERLLILGGMLVLLFDIDISGYVKPIIIFGFPLLIFTKWFGGDHPLIKKFQNALARIFREKNDSQMQDLIRKVDEIHNKIFE